MGVFLIAKEIVDKFMITVQVVLHVAEEIPGVMDAEMQAEVVEMEVVEMEVEVVDVVDVEMEVEVVAVEAEAVEAEAVEAEAAEVLEKTVQ